MSPEQIYKELTETDIASDIIDQEDLGFDIDIVSIDQKSKDNAIEMIQNLSELYCNDEFMKTHPSFKKRVDSELDSLRLLLKMRAADEIVQDNLTKAIANNPKVAALYKSLSDLQKTILAISSKIDENIRNLNTLIKGYQLELNFKEEEQGEQENDTSSDDKIGHAFTTRGSKDYILKMQQSEVENEPIDY